MKILLEKYIPVKLAIMLLTLLFSISILFHLLILTGILPFSIVWGGKLKTFNDVYAFEGISVISNSLMLVIVLSKNRLINLKISQRNYRIVFWAIAALFLLNTFGNLVSENSIETLIFTPITLISSIFSARIAID